MPQHGLLAAAHRCTQRRKCWSSAASPPCTVLREGRVERLARDPRGLPRSCGPSRTAASRARLPGTPCSPWSSARSTPRLAGPSSGVRSGWANWTHPTARPSTASALCRCVSRPNAVDTASETGGAQSVRATCHSPTPVARTPATSQTGHSLDGVAGPTFRLSSSGPPGRSGAMASAGARTTAPTAMVRTIHSARTTAANVMSPRNQRSGDLTTRLASETAAATQHHDEQGIGEGRSAATRSRTGVRPPRRERARSPRRGQGE